MDIADYISSGILEAYVLGAVTSQERQEVECMSHIYPEIDEELKRAQLAFENFAIAEAVSPDPQLKDRILQAAFKDDTASAETPINDSPKIISLNKENTNQKTTWGFYLAAACAIGAIILAVLFYKNYEDTKSQLAFTQKEQEIEKNQILEEKEKALFLANQISMENSHFLHKDTKKLILGGTPDNPEAQATIYYNTSYNEAMLTVENLPVPETSKQYQLWAISDGKPIDMGVFDMKSDAVKAKMKVDIENIQAFAITLETAGGNPTPDLTQLKVIGNV